MSKIRLSCQTITYGDEQYLRFPQVLEHVASVGYDGVEIGYRRLAPIDATKMRSMLDEHRLALSGSHIGGNLEDLDQADGERNLIETVLDYLERVGTDTLMYSGLRYENPSQLSRDIEMLNRSAELSASRGVNLLYHNHNWEFENDSAVLKALVVDGSEALGFCPDVGWIAKAGHDPVETLDLLGDRVRMIHFKDFATLDPGAGVDTVELGDGVVPLEHVIEWIRGRFDEFWVIAEQDKSAISAEDAVEKNARWMQARFS